MPPALQHHKQAVCVRVCVRVCFSSLSDLDFHLLVCGRPDTVSRDDVLENGE
jgi:hypothetical protein